MTMQPTIPQTTRRLARCAPSAAALCWQTPGRPCTVSGPPGDHLSRYAAAVRLGLLTKAELAAIVGGLTVVADHVIILEQTP
jgi:hypothetical protein